MYQAGNNRLYQIYSRIDYPLLAGIMVLCLIGLVIQYSASGGDVSQLIQQLVRIVVATAVMIYLAYIPTHTLYKYAPHLYVIGVLLLILVLLIGTIGRGAQRWLNLGFLTVQPSELLKLAVPMFVAWVLTQKIPYSHSFRSLICGVLVLVPAYLIYKQPDLGTAILVCAIGVFAIFLAGLAWRWIAAISILVVSAIPIIWPLLHDYQRARVLTMFDPWKDPLGDGYHTIQSMIAIGSGGIYGKGWLEGSQSQLEFIPERSTDFVFSVFAEEFGLIGSTILILTYLFLIIRTLTIAFLCKSNFGTIVVGSVAVMIFFHFFVNLGMVMGILPIVGIPLPMLSYGGTSMVTILAGLGIAMGAKYATQ